MSRISKGQSAAIELVVASGLWGFGFIATVWALRSMGPLAITGWRFLFAVVVGFSITLALPKLRKQLSTAQFKLAFIPGLLLCATLVLQTWGLKYTTATKSGFITTLYVLFVPLIERVWLKKTLPRFHFLYVVVALIGVALVCDLRQAAGDVSKQAWNFGDLLTLLCAIAASFQILWFGILADRIGSAFLFNNFQSVWAGILPLALSLSIEAWPTPNFADMSAQGLMMLAFGSTLIAFALQVRAQKFLSPSVASLLFLLESPFATLFAIALLGETLKPAQWLGASLILAAAAASTLVAGRSQAKSLADPSANS